MALHEANGGDSPAARMVEDLQVIATDLERLLMGVLACAGLLALILVVLVLRLLGVGG